jgi:hypothetical protein
MSIDLHSRFVFFLFFCSASALGQPLASPHPTPSCLARLGIPDIKGLLIFFQAGSGNQG